MQDGHTVTIASHPEYRTWVESFGISYKDVGGDPGALMASDLLAFSHLP
jgi:sterol 3beta-glucosyltransferase